MSQNMPNYKNTSLVSKLVKKCTNFVENIRMKLLLRWCSKYSIAKSRCGHTRQMETYRKVSVVYCGSQTEYKSACHAVAKESKHDSAETEAQA